MVALVTGAGGSIGLAIVERLLEDGHDVIAQDRRIGHLELSGLASDRLTLVEGDLLDPALPSILRSVRGFDALDRVIAAHGVEGSGAISDTSDARTRLVMDVNAGAVVSLLDVVTPALSRNSGAFVVINSQAGLVGEAANVAYCASKFAIVGWARAVAPRLSENGIALRLLCPGCTKTPILFDAMERFAAAEGLATEEFTRRRQAQIPVGRFAEPAQTAASAVFLSDGSRARPAIFAATGGEVLY